MTLDIEPHGTIERCRPLRSAGHGRRVGQQWPDAVIFRSDQERALVALKNEAAIRVMQTARYDNRGEWAGRSWSQGRGSSARTSRPPMRLVASSWVGTMS